MATLPDRPQQVAPSDVSLRNGEMPLTHGTTLSSRSDRPATLKNKTKTAFSSPSAKRVIYEASSRGFPLLPLRSKPADVDELSTTGSGEPEFPPELDSDYAPSVPESDTESESTTEECMSSLDAGTSAANLKPIQELRRSLDPAQLSSWVFILRQSPAFCAPSETSLRTTSTLNPPDPGRICTKIF
jgi:hypothetical protein